MSKEIIKKPNSDKLQIDKGKFTSDMIKAQAAALSKFEIPPVFRQLVVFVLDASESMTWNGLSGKSKGEEISDQIAPIIERLQKSRNSNCFDVSMFAFSQKSNEFIKLKNVKDIDTTAVDFNPCVHVGNYQTYVKETLKEVETRVNEYLNKYAQDNCQALIIFLSDGDLYDYDESYEICDRLRANNKITIASYLLEDKNWNNILPEEELNRLKNNIRGLSSSSKNNLDENFEFFLSKVDPEEIRKHMIKSISTVSKVD